MVIPTIYSLIDDLTVFTSRIAAAAFEKTPVPIPVPVSDSDGPSTDSQRMNP
jgi:hypothetical protein